MRSLLKKKYIIFLGILFVAIGAYAYSSSGSGSAGTGEPIKVIKGSISEEVTLTGRVRSTRDVDLAFERTGKISTGGVKVGDIVKEGVELIRIDARDLQAQLAQSRAGVKVAQAQLHQFEAALRSQNIKLKELKIGARPEELQIARTKVESAQSALADAKHSLELVEEKANRDQGSAYEDVPDVLRDAYAKTDDIVRNKTATIFTLSDGVRYKININACSDSLAEIEASGLRLDAENALLKWKSKLDTINRNSPTTDLDEALDIGANTLSITRQLFQRLSDIYNATCNLEDISTATDRATIATIRTLIEPIITAVNSQRQAVQLVLITNDTAVSTAKAKVNDAQNALSAAQDELRLKVAGNRPETIEAQEAAVSQAEANVEAQRAQISQAEAGVLNSLAQIEKTVIISPFAGMVTKVEIERGEIASPGTPVISLISLSQFEVEAKVSEIDIGRVAIGNPVHISIDAFPGESFEGKIVYIEPAETIVDGVVNFSITIAFSQNDERLKSGLTTNLTIETQKKEDVLLLPQHTIIEKDEGNFVKIVRGGQESEVEVVLGIRGQDGMVEIVSGVEEGDLVANVGLKQ